MVCSEQKRAYNFRLARRGAVDCGDGASPTEHNCEAQADSLAGRHQGRQHLVVGAWGHVPFGCSLQTGGDYAAHYNYNPGGRNDGGYSLVCSERARGYSFRLASGGSNDCGDGASPTESSCEAQADSLAGGRHQGRQHLVVGSWGYVPSGCSLQTGGDWAAHYNLLAIGRNDGGAYSLVCSKRDAQLEAPLYKTPGCYALVLWNHDTFGTTRLGAHWKVEAPQDNVIAQFSSAFNSAHRDRQFTIAYWSLWPGELLWSRWTAFSSLGRPAKTECKPMEVLTGIESVRMHASFISDRTWRIRCSRVLAANEGIRWWSGWQNNFGQAFELSPMGQAQLMVGIESVYDSGSSDRRFRFAFSSYTGCKP